MVPSVAFMFVTLLAISHCSTIPEQPQTNPPSDVPEVPSSTGQPEKTTRGPHTHDEHPVDDPDHSDHDHSVHDHTSHDHSVQDHSDHAHVEDPKAVKVSEDGHEHPGHDHSKSGHDHKLDHPKESAKEGVEGTKPSPTEDALKKNEEVAKEGEEGSEKRAKRGLWRRRLD